MTKKNKKRYRQGKSDAFHSRGAMDNRSDYVGKERRAYVKGYLKGTIKLLKAENDELQTSFDLRWKADMRAIKKWQEKTGRELVWPDHADLCVWLMDELKELKKEKKNGN
jgi:hypothetical protein